MFGGLGDFINQVASSDAGRVMGIPLGVAGATAAGIAADTGALVAKGDARPLAKRAMRTPLALPFHLYENLKTMTEGQ
jgi:NAD/NADP transhydrogenase alpha subunit